MRVKIYLSNSIYCLSKIKRRRDEVTLSSTHQPHQLTQHLNTYIIQAANFFHFTLYSSYKFFFPPMQCFLKSFFLNVTKTHTKIEEQNKIDHKKHVSRLYKTENLNKIFFRMHIKTKERKLNRFGIIYWKYRTIRNAPGKLNRSE